MRFLQFPKSSLTLAQEFFPGDNQRICAIMDLGLVVVFSLLPRIFFLNNIGNSLSEFLC